MPTWQESQAAAAEFGRKSEEALRNAGSAVEALRKGAPAPSQNPAPAPGQPSIQIIINPN